jgi:hypothetical protein
MAAPASAHPLPSPALEGMTPPGPPVKTKGAAATSTTRSRRTTKRRPTGVALPIIFIEWEDHHSSDQWINDEDLVVRSTPILNQSIGWLLRETENVLIVYSCHSGSAAHEADNPYAHAQTILKKCITKRVVLHP